MNPHSLAYVVMNIEDLFFRQTQVPFTHDKACFIFFATGITLGLDTKIIGKTGTRILTISTKEKILVIMKEV